MSHTRPPIPTPSGTRACPDAPVMVGRGNGRDHGAVRDSIGPGPSVSRHAATLLAQRAIGHVLETGDVCTDQQTIRWNKEYCKEVPECPPPLMLPLHWGCGQSIRRRLTCGRSPRRASRAAGSGPPRPPARKNRSARGMIMHQHQRRRRRRGGRPRSRREERRRGKGSNPTCWRCCSARATPKAMTVYPRRHRRPRRRPPSTPPRRCYSASAAPQKQTEQICSSTCTRLSHLI